MKREIITSLINDKMICADCKSRYCNCGNTTWVLKIEDAITLIDNIVNQDIKKLDHTLTERETR